MLTLSDLISYGVAILLLFVMYKKVIAPFAKKMLDVNSEDDHDLDYTGIDFDDFEFEEEDKDAELKAKMDKLRKKMNLNSDLDEDKVRYDILLERMQEIAREKPEEVTDILTSLTKDKVSDIK